jgi:hypothetical protein
VSLLPFTTRTRGGAPYTSRGGARSAPGNIATSFFLIAVAIASPVTAVAQQYVPAEYRSKAAFLATFPSFVDWPDGTFSPSEAQLVVCVLGDFRFGTTLAQVSRTSMPHGRRVAVRWIRGDRQIHGCHILFVSNTEVAHYSKIIALVQGTSTFTVGETTDFIAAGGMLSLSFSNESIQFEVNLSSAREAHFHVSSKLLALAHRVVDETESTKS